MAKHTNLRLYKFHKSLYQRAIEDASKHAPFDAPSVIKYSKEFYRSLPKSYKRTDLEHITKKLDSTQLMLFGDFHTHRQTQKGLIRLLDNYRLNNPHRPLVLAMEMFRAKDQEYINDFLKDEISEGELLRLCEYEKIWGFPWENYKLIIDFAKNHDIQIIGINTDFAGKDPLPKRDQFAANILSNLLSEKNDCLCACLIGEYHLADKHLISHFDRPEKVIRILTNIDEFYFSRENYKEYSSTEYISLKSNLYCLLNSPPWIKWRSYSIWEEKRSSEIGYDPSIQYTEEAFDIDYQVVSIITHLTEFLNISLPESEIANFHSYTDFDLGEAKSILNSKKASSYTKSILSRRLYVDGIFYAPESRQVFIDKHSLNNLSELAGQILFSILHGDAAQKDDRYQFLYRVLMSSAGVLASKTLNPRRRCPDIYQFESNLNRLQNRRLSEGDRIYRRALRDVIKIYYRILQGNYRISSALAIRDSQDGGIYSLMLGQIIGIESYNAIMNPKKTHIRHEDIFQFSQKINEVPSMYRSLLDFIFHT